MPLVCIPIVSISSTILRGSFKQDEALGLCTALRLFYAGSLVLRASYGNIVSQLNCIEDKTTDIYYSSCSSSYLLLYCIRIVFFFIMLINLDIIYFTFIDKLTIVCLAKIDYERINIYMLIKYVIFYNL